MSNKLDQCEPDFEFSNWDSTITSNPQCYFQPRTEAEVVEIVQDVYKRGGLVRTFGAGHSWSALVPNPDTLINLDRLNHFVSVDKGQMRASVQSGIRIKNLIKGLRNNGLGMRNLGSIAEQSIAGAISTATHGTGLNIGNLPTQITAMNLVTGRGELRTISIDRDPELMAAARTSLGALGIITQVTIQAVKDYNLRYKSEYHPFDEVLDRVNHDVVDNERLRLYWLTLIPDSIRVMTMNAPSKTATPDDNPTTELSAGLVKNGVLQPASPDTYDLNRWPGLGVHVDLNAKKEVEGRMTWLNKDQVQPYDRALTVPMPPLHQESEYAIPWDRAAEAVRAVRKLIDDKNFSDVILVEVRFVDQDETMLSPAFRRQVCYIGGYIFGDLNATEFFNDFERLMKSLGGKPHWGKHLTLSTDEAQHMYPLFNRFNEIRRDLDPKGIFANEFIRNLFG